MHRHPACRASQLIASCVILGVGVGMVLSARLGSDGYSSLVNGTVRAGGVPYALVNPALGLALVLVAWTRGVRPGPGTITHPIVVGVVVNTVLNLISTPESLLLRGGLLVAGVLLVSVGVAGYLDAELGSGPVEAATLALRPIPFRVAYNGLQALGALTGWVLGADIGVGTVVVVLTIGPIVHALNDRVRKYRSARVSCFGFE